MGKECALGYNLTQEAPWLTRSWFGQNWLENVTGKFESITEFEFKAPDLYAELNLNKNVQTFQLHNSFSLFERTKANSCTSRMHRAQLDVRWAPEMQVGVSSQFLWCGSLYSICATVWLQSKRAHGPTVTRVLGKLENLPFLIIWQGWWVFDGGVGASLHLCMVSPSTCTLCN